MKKQIMLGCFVLICLTILGCETVQQTARGIGQPIGTVARIPQSITEGAAEGFVGDRDANPYGR